MNEIRQNAFKALAVSVVLTLPLMFLMDKVVQIEYQNINEKTNCLDQNTVCDILPFHYFLIPIPLLIYYLTFNYFEKNRKKTWRSYH